MGKINVDILTTKLIKIRDQNKRNRKHCANQALEYLGLPDNSVSIKQFDALLIRAIAEHFDDSRDADVLLMAFGLLQGYHYAEIISIGERRKKYLIESNYLQTHPRKQEPYATATNEKKKKLEENLRKAEDIRITSLAKYLVEQSLKDGGIEKYVKSHISPIAIPQPSYILSEDEPEPTPADDDVDDEVKPDTLAPPEVLHPDKSTADDVSDEVDQDTAPHPEDTPSDTGDQQGGRSEERSQSDTSDTQPNPKGFKIHIGGISIGPLININKKSQTTVNLSWVKNPVLLIFVVIAAIAAGMIFFSPQTSPENELSQENGIPAVEEIFPSEHEIVLVPGETCPLKVAVLPIGAQNAPLNFVSADTRIVTVSHTGVLEAHNNPQGQLYHPVEITIQAESGVTKTKTVTVDFSNGRAPEVNEEVAAGYYVWQQMRLAGTTEWATSVDAEIGDIVEIQIQYKNIGETTQEDVMIRDVLPPNLVYVPETTKLYNVKYDGARIGQDTIATTGIDIGNYTSGSNAYVRFSAKVVDVTLAPGSNTLVNWSQAGVGQITLNDYATTVVQK